MPGRSLEALARRFSARFFIRGRSVEFSVVRWPGPPADGPLVLAWRSLLGAEDLAYTQQIGRKPTFLGVASCDPELGRAFALELICGAWCWRQLQKAHTLFIIDEQGEVRAFSGLPPRPQPELVEVATQHVLPLVQARVTAMRAGRMQRDATLQACALRPICVSGNAVACAGSMPAAAALSHRGAGRVLVEGALEQTEAAALAAELASGQLWKPERHGDLRVSLSPSGIEVLLGNPDPTDTLAIRQFAAGFTRHVILADLHLGKRGRDTFGPAKVPALLKILEEAIVNRSVVVLNGDFLELMHERYRDIKRSYPEVFEKLPGLRRIVYVTGNHDDEILQETIKETRRACRTVAAANAFGEVTLGLFDEILVSALPGHVAVPRQRHWYRVLRDSRMQGVVLDILKSRRGAIRLSRGFASEGVAFKREGTRDTTEERPLWHLDEDILRRGDPAGELAQLMSDRRQRLDRVIRRDWGNGVEIVRYYWSPAQRLYAEHGHFGIPSCHESLVGRHLSRAAGWAKRLGFTHVETFFEERLGDLVRAIYPLDVVCSNRRFIDRTLAVGAAIRTIEGGADGFTIVCSHTHERACHEAGPVDHFLREAFAGSYANTGAWSSRLRRDQGGDRTAEWIEIEPGRKLELKHVRVAGVHESPFEPRTAPRGDVVPEAAPG
jgi:UDP-2,3-diacylglucosamine pyrophosphatase LpxH